MQRIQLNPQPITLQQLPTIYTSDCPYIPMPHIALGGKGSYSCQRPKQDIVDSIIVLLKLGNVVTTIPKLMMSFSNWPAKNYPNVRSSQSSFQQKDTETWMSRYYEQHWTNLLNNYNFSYGAEGRHATGQKVISTSRIHFSKSTKSESCFYSDLQ